MATIHFSPTLVQETFLNTASPGTYGTQWGFASQGILSGYYAWYMGGFGSGMSDSISDNGNSLMFVFKGTVPTDFTNLSISSRSSDLLMAIPAYNSNIGNISNTAIRMKVGISSSNPMTTRSQNLSLNSGTGTLIRSNNTTTVSVSSNDSYCSPLIPGLSVTYTNSSNPSYSGTFTITSASSTSVSWTNPGPNANNLAASSGTLYLNTAAIASGNASWFLIITGNRRGKDLFTANLGETTYSWLTGQYSYPAVLGTIGTIGSGADLEMSSTSIVAGRNYNSYGFYINWPCTWDI